MSQTRLRQRNSNQETQRWDAHSSLRCDQRRNKEAQEAICGLKSKAATGRRRESAIQAQESGAYEIQKSDKICNK